MPQVSQSCLMHENSTAKGDPASFANVDELATSLKNAKTSTAATPQAGSEPIVGPDEAKPIPNSESEVHSVTM
jgi:hypothetical protein